MRSDDSVGRTNPPPERRMWARYSRERDVLFVSVQPVPHALSEPGAADFFWLRDTTTGDLIGFECLWFSRNMRDREWLRGLPQEPTFTVEGKMPARPLAEVLPEVWRLLLVERPSAILALV
jgi:hypothetical protein